jgi:dihydroorotate dehydrogenase
MPDILALATAALRILPPETAHRLALAALKMPLHPMGLSSDDPVLRTDVFGLQFSNPVGIAAGFDKDAEAFDGLLKLGFGFVEVGSIVPEPQPGNPKPRLFRLKQDKALINRMGFNSRGLAYAQARLAARRADRRGIVGVNIGKNRSGDAAADYGRGVRALAPFADYLAVNVSSPNTPGLRALQSPEQLESLIAVVRRARDEAGLERPAPLLLKLAPDLTAEDRRNVAAVVERGGIDGLILGNTTVSRPASLRDPRASEAGGLSGAPLFALATEALRDMYRVTRGRLPLIGVGGIGSGADAYAKIRAGASLVQLYTALVYDGPGLVAKIKADLAALLRRDGFARLADAVGADHRIADPR